MTKDRITGEKKTTTFIYAYDTHTRESDEYLKEVRIWGLRAILIKGDTSVEKCQDKGKGIWASRGSKLWKGKCMGENHGVKSYFSQVSVPSGFLPPGTGEGKGNTFIHGREMSILLFGKGGRAESSLDICCFLIPAAQNNPYVQVEYFGVAYSDHLQYFIYKWARISAQKN